MNLEAARRVADTVLYEGYVLYPYRACAQKNRSRWQFGVLLPAGFAAGDGSESSFSQTECVLESTVDTRVSVLIRLLQLQRRTVEQRRGDAYVPVPVLSTSDGGIATWDEAVEHEVTLTVDLPDLLGEGRQETLAIPGGVETEEVRSAEGAVLGRVRRERRPLDGVVYVSGRPVPGGTSAVWLRVRVANTTALDPVPADRHDALPAGLLAVHTILGVEHGAYVSMVDPPDWAWPHVNACTNVGSWPVLAGPEGTRDLVLSSPIILYDHPRIAPESPGDLYDATEIDEILSLRTLALTDDEKRAARATDTRAAAVIDRTDSLDAAAWDRLHGTIRRTDTETPPWWDPAEDASVSPHTDTVLVDGARVGRGSRVRLRPGARRADAQDMFLIGREAMVEAVFLDVDDNPYLAVTLADDPAADLQRSHGRYLYFVPDEVEPYEVSR